MLMGEPGGHQDEGSSLTVNVWAPEGARDLPVLFWLHGGALLSGSASWSWYDGARLAASQNIVVVTASHRLGALGYLDLRDLDHSDDTASPNAGLLDQMAALEWVVDHVADFGGRPDLITVGGQSAGAESAALIAGSPRTGAHAHRLLLQSGGSHGWVQSNEVSAAVAEEFLEVVRRTHGPRAATLAGLRSLPVDAVLRAQVELLTRRAARGLTDPPFGVAEASGVPLGGTRHFLSTRPDLPLFAGWARDELQGFVVLNPAAGTTTEDAALEVLGATYGIRAADVLAHYRSTRPQATPAELVAAVSGDAVMMAPLMDLADERAAVGAPAFLYRFDWSDSPFGACHCIDLPFAFGNLSAWPDAAMLGDTPRDELEPVARATTDAIGAFVRSGRPELPSMPGHEPDRPEWPDWSVDQSVARLGGSGATVSPGLGQAERRLLTVESVTNH